MLELGGGKELMAGKERKSGRVRKKNMKWSEHVKPESESAKPRDVES